MERKRSLDEVKADLTALISGGGFVAGMKLPSEHDLMKRFHAGRHILRRALESLRADGVIETERGSRSRVLQPHPVYTEPRTPHDPGTLVEPIGELLTHRAEASTAAAAMFGVEPGSLVFHSEQKGRHRVTGTGILLARHVPAAPWIELDPSPEPLGDRATLLTAFNGRFGPINATERARFIETPPAETLDALGAEPTEPFPVCELRRFHRTRRGRLLLMETHTSRAGALELQYDL